jgi:ubiquinone/menaquinone biosynthesis C-methylase UbiE
MLQNTKEFWSQKWKQHFTRYHAQVALQAYYLDFFLNDKNVKSILEIAAGSCRDTTQLNEWGYDAMGVDFSHECIEMAKRRFPRYQKKFVNMDAFRLNFSDKEFDVSFHNGFFICFHDNQDIKNLLQEQARVTKRFIICSVHNQMNTYLVDKFRRMSASDKLYDVRFFNPDEISSLLRPFCKQVEVLPFTYLPFDLLIKAVKSKSCLRLIYNQYVKRLNLKSAKRIMAIGYLS